MNNADTNRKIAEARGWGNFQERDRRVYGRPPERKTRNILTERQIPDCLHDANDALELAEKMDVRFERRPYAPEAERYAAWLDPLEHCEDTLPAAICAAVDAVLERM